MFDKFSEVSPGYAGHKLHVPDYPYNRQYPL